MSILRGSGFNGISMGSPTTGMVIGPGGAIYRTTNAGLTWSPQTSGTTNTLHEVSMVDANNGTAVGVSGTVLRTTNGGATWVSEPNPLSGVTELFSVWFVSPNEGWAVGVGGRIIHRNPISSVEREEVNAVPVSYSLGQNYPNPFNPSTEIRFQITDYRLVTLKMYDLLGREVATLVHEELKEGSYQTTFDASGLSSGTYFYRINAGNFVETRKMILVR